MQNKDLKENIKQNLEEVHQQGGEAVVKLLGKDDVTGHDHVHAGQVLREGVNIIPTKSVMVF